jgi:hypothetical protein
MSVLRSWLGFLAIGAGLVHVALAVGSPPAVAAALVVVGAAEFAWGALAIARPTPLAPQLARAAALIPVIGWALLLVVAGTDSLGPLTSSTQLLPMLVASLFDLLVAGGLTAMLRRAAPAAPAPAAAAATTPAAIAHPGRRLVAVVIGALVIAAITAPALAATEAGQLAGNPGTSFVGTPGHDH